MYVARGCLFEFPLSTFEYGVAGDDWDVWYLLFVLIRHGLITSEGESGGETFITKLGEGRKRGDEWDVYYERGRKPTGIFDCGRILFGGRVGVYIVYWNSYAV